MAIASGRLQIRDWTDRDGNKRRSAEVVADQVYFGETKRRDEAEATASPSSGNATAAGLSRFSELNDCDDGELPF